MGAFDENRAADRPPAQPELPAEQYRKHNVIRQTNDRPTNRSWHARRFYDLHKLCGIDAPVARRLFQGSLAIRAIMDSHGYLAETPIMLDIIASMCKIWPDYVPVDEDGYFTHEDQVADMGALTESFPYLKNEELHDVKYRFKFQKMYRGMAIHQCKRSRYQNFNWMMKWFWCLREELGEYTQGWMDSTILSIDRHMYIGTCIDKDDPDKRYKFNQFTVGDPAEWLTKMFRSCATVYKLRGEVTHYRGGETNEKDEDDQDRTANVLVDLRNGALQRLHDEAVERANQAMEERDSGTLNPPADEYIDAVLLEQPSVDIPVDELERTLANTDQDRVVIIPERLINYVEASDDDEDMESETGESDTTSNESEGSEAEVTRVHSIIQRLLQ